MQGKISTRRVARAKSYGENLAQRQSTLTDSGLVRESPFRVRRVVGIKCSAFNNGRTLIGHFTSDHLAIALSEKQCGGAHRVGKREWAVMGVGIGATPMIVERFNCVLMAKALRDDLNLKAATVIMKQE
jgi:hypothetical protein